jgi:hypothetical protein
MLASGYTFLMAVREEKRLGPVLNPGTFNFKASDLARQSSPLDYRARK